MLGLTGRLAARDDPLRAGALGELGDVRRDVDQQPVGEVLARRVLGDRLSLLVGVCEVGRHVGVVDGEHERLRALGRARPAQVRTSVASLGRRLALPVGYPECVLVGNPLTVVEAVGLDRQCHLLLLVRRTREV